MPDDAAPRKPTHRRLRTFAVDPSLATKLDTADINEIAIKIPWEDNLKPGPIGEYVEVIDYDPASQAFYPPIDLNHPHVLADDGLAPSEANPLFHQQMVYAVAMTTIAHFERALGRVAFWGSVWVDKADTWQFVRRLRLYPHAMRDRNAYYSPDRKAVLFGYFPVRDKDADNAPGTLVFTCLSHDIIAHEVTHALLDGLHPRFHEPTNPDVHAFHEAFADIVALFQHFSYPGLLRREIARNRGDLSGDSMLGQLAQQFGRATGTGGALRDFLGKPVNGEKWVPRPPDVRAYEKVMEPHARGALLVAAVFRAFLKVYDARVRSLLRIASNGTGRLPEGDIHPDLAARLAEEAQRCATYVLQMCIRALDYCPPVDVTFGDYLRALITADVTYNPEDELGVRVALIESFRQWGIYPQGIRNLSIESLQWPEFKGTHPSLKKVLSATLDPLNRETDRSAIWKQQEDNCRKLWHWLVTEGAGTTCSEDLGLVLDNGAAPPNKPQPSVYRGNNGNPSVAVHSVRLAVRRTGPWQSPEPLLVVEIVQRRRGYFDPKIQEKIDSGAREIESVEVDFKYRAGCTVHIDPLTMQIMRIIRTAGNVADDGELERVRAHLTGASDDSATAFSSGRLSALYRGSSIAAREPFALLHRHAED